jgi:hypothetical protein
VFAEPKSEAVGFDIFNRGHLVDKYTFFLLQITQSKSALQISAVSIVHLHFQQKGGCGFFAFPDSTSLDKPC